MKRVYRFAALVFAVLLATGLAVRWQAMRALRSAGASYTSEREVAFEVRKLPSATGNGFEWISAPAMFSNAAVFQGKLYISGPAGLFEFDARGKLTKHYRVGGELPPSPLTRMTQGIIAGSHQPDLVIATEREGVLLFNGAEFRQIRAVDPAARAVTDVLLLSSGQLLIATNKKGVLAYDGNRIGYFHPTLAGLRATSLAGTDSDLWVGTLDNGVLHWHGGQVEKFSEAEGLPDRAVLSLAVNANTAYVGTSAGVAEFVSGRMSRLLGRGHFASSLYVTGDKLLIGTIDQGLLELPLRLARASIIPSQGAELGSVRRIFVSAGAIYALVENELYSRGSSALAWKRVLDRQPALLTDRNISAVEAGPDGRLWVGYFDRGLDILDGGGQRVTHVEDEYVFCVNRLLSDPRRRQVDVATANGLVLFDATGSKLRVLGRADGLIANHVTDVDYTARDWHSPPRRD